MTCKVTGLARSRAAPAATPSKTARPASSRVQLDRGRAATTRSHRLTRRRRNHRRPVAIDGRRLWQHLLEACGEQQTPRSSVTGATPDDRQLPNGFLYFYNNTIVSLRTDPTTLLALSTALDALTYGTMSSIQRRRVRLFNVVGGAGTSDATRNWIKSGYVVRAPGASTVINDDGTWRTGSAPGFVDLDARDFGLASGSGAIDTGGSLAAAVRCVVSGDRTVRAASASRRGPISGADRPRRLRKQGRRASGESAAQHHHHESDEWRNGGRARQLYLSATASDSDGSVAYVDFFANGSHVARRDETILNGVVQRSGRHVRDCRDCRRQAGNSTTTPAVSVTVTPAAQQLTPVADAYVRGGSSASQNYGSSASLEVMNSNSVDRIGTPICDSICPGSLPSRRRRCASTDG